jgi:hypothetical protein
VASPDLPVGGPTREVGHSRPVAPNRGESGRSTEVGIQIGEEVDQSVARKAQQEPEGEMEGTETAATEEAL